MKNLLRTVVRRLSRGVVLSKRLPADLGGGKVYCSPEALLSVLKPGWGSPHFQGLMNWAWRFVEPGMVVWDLGANQGVFTFSAAARAGAGGEIVAFEPDMFLVDLLLRSSRMHSGANVHVFPIAVSSQREIAEFEIARTDRTLNHLSSAKGNPHTGGARERRMVVCETLDWLDTQLKHPDLIKIDVEGAELAVLKGAHRLLSERRSTFIIEASPENVKEVTRLLSAEGYVLFDADGDLQEPIVSDAWNILAIPVEKVDGLKSRMRIGG